MHIILGNQICHSFVSDAWTGNQSNEWSSPLSFTRCFVLLAECRHDHRCGHHVGNCEVWMILTIPLSSWSASPCQLQVHLYVPSRGAYYLGLPNCRIVYFLNISHVLMPGCCHGIPPPQSNVAFSPTCIYPSASQSPLSALCAFWIGSITALETLSGPDCLTCIPINCTL